MSAPVKGFIEFGRQAQPLSRAVKSQDQPGKPDPDGWAGVAQPLPELSARGQHD